MTGPAHKGSHTKMLIVALFIGKTNWKHLSAHKQGTVKYTGVCSAVKHDGREKLRMHMASDLAIPLLETYPTALPMDTKVFAQGCPLPWVGAKASKHPGVRQQGAGSLNQGPRNVNKKGGPCLRPPVP